MSVYAKFFGFFVCIFVMCYVLLCLFSCVSVFVYFVYPRLCVYVCVYLSCLFLWFYCWLSNKRYCCRWTERRALWFYPKNIFMSQFWLSPFNSNIWMSTLSTGRNAWLSLLACKICNFNMPRFLIIFLLLAHLWSIFNDQSYWSKIFSKKKSVLDFCKVIDGLVRVIEFISTFLPNNVDQELPKAQE